LCLKFLLNVLVLSVQFNVEKTTDIDISAQRLVMLYRVDQKMSAEHSVYSAHEAQEMLSNTKEMSKSVRRALSEKHQLLQVCRIWLLSVTDLYSLL